VLGIPLAEVAASFTTRKLPLSSLNPVGTVTGPVKGTWRGSIHDLRANGDLAIAAPENAAPEQMPVTGTVIGDFKLRPGTFDISHADLRSRAAQLTASGSLAPTSGDLKINLNATSIRELLPIVDAVRGPEPLPVNVGGALSFNGTMTGKFLQPTIIGHLELRDFTTVVPKAAAGAAAQAAASGLAQTSAPATQLLHWEQLSADIQYSPTFASINHGIIRHGAAQINLDASATLSAGQFTNTSPFTARLNIRNADIIELQSIAGYNYPLSGTVNANLQVAGTAEDPHGAGHLSLRNVVAYGQPITSADADIAVLNQQTELRNVAIVADAGRITGTATHNMKSEAFRLNLVGSGIQLAQIRQLRIKRMNIEGLVDFKAEGSGTLSEPVINAQMHMTKALINGEPIGDMTADAVTHGADLKLTARSSYQKAQLTLDGNVHLRGDFPSTIDLRFGDIYLDPLIKAYLPGRMTGKSTVAGTLQVRGPLKQPRALNAELNLDRVQANLEYIAIHNDGSVRIVMADQLVRIERFRLVGEETHFIEATGTAQLAGAQRLNFKAAGNINLKLLQTFNPDIISSGTSTFGIDVLGTIKHPTLQGRMEIANGSMSYIDLPNGLSGINGTLVFSQDRLQVERLTAKSGGGELVLGGFITYEKAITFNLTARGHDIRLRYPPGVSATADADITLAGTLKSSLLSGEITVTKFGINPRFDFGQYLAQSKAPPQLPKADSPLNGLRFDVHVVSTPELEVQTSLARVSGDVDLRLRGNAARPTVLGRVNIVEGDVFFNGTQYHLERGDVTFTNPVRIEPVLDLEASARVRDYDITLGFHGSIDKLGTTYRSDPPLPTGDIIALLALGRTREDTYANSMNSSNNPASNTTLTDSASNALLGQALNATVSSRVQKLFGVSRIKIDPQVGGPENNPNARLTIEQQVSNKVTLTYITNLSQSAQQVIQVEYNINKSVSILAVRDQTGVVGFDVRVRQRKK
jgi:translocation and assembly module TamB